MLAQQIVAILAVTTAIAAAIIAAAKNAAGGRYFKIKIVATEMTVAVDALVLADVAADVTMVVIAVTNI